MLKLPVKWLNSASDVAKRDSLILLIFVGLLCLVGTTATILIQLHIPANLTYLITSKKVTFQLNYTN